MKTFRILSAGLLVVASAAIASAVTTTIHITGSTAFRGATMTAIEHLMIAGGTTYQSCYYTGDASSSLNGANIAILSGTVTGVGPVVVKAHWTGSTGGIQTLVQNITDSNWLANATFASSAAIAVTGGAGGATVASLGGNTDSAAIADITMEDSHQASTGFTATTLTETQVGVIVFEWVANNGAPTTVANITPLQVQSLVSATAVLSQFTGNSSDSGVAVYAAGRNFDSGTRLSELAESGVGVFGNVQQVQVTNNGTIGVTGNVTGIRLYPSETVLGIHFGNGTSGYSSGGTLGKTLATPGSNGGSVTGDEGAGWLIGYLGRNDAVTAVSHLTGGNATNTANRLTWNGVADWTAGTSTISGGEGVVADDTPVTEGLYTAWEYEWLAYRGTFADGNQAAGSKEKTLADAIATQIISTDAAVSGTLLGAMHVSRPIEGGAISHN